MRNASYAIERIDDDGGPLFRLVGPGVVSKWYASTEQLQRLEDIRDLLNYAVRASTGDRHGADVHTEVDHG